MSSDFDKFRKSKRYCWMQSLTGAGETAPTGPFISVSLRIETTGSGTTLENISTATTQDGQAESQVGMELAPASFMGGAGSWVAGMMLHASPQVIKENLLVQSASMIDLQEVTVFV